MHIYNECPSLGLDWIVLSLAESVVVFAVVCDDHARAVVCTAACNNSCMALDCLLRYLIINN